MMRDALIVGINNYQFLPSLRAPTHDAEAVAQILESYGDFRVTRLPEAIEEGRPRVGARSPVSLQALEASLVRLFKPKGRNIPHTALFYFSGHGLQKDAGIQEGYLALSDANPAQGFYGLSLFWLRRLLQESPVRQRIVLLDCCHSGELLNFAEADPGASAGVDRLFMAASRDYEVAYESLESPYSVFTQALLEGLDPRQAESGLVTNYSLTTAVNRGLKGQIQQPLFENSGSEIVLTRCDRPLVSVPASSAIACPYPGLQPFSEEQAPGFFGREAVMAQLLDRVQHHRWVTLVGGSASGKTSLLRAGLVPALRQMGDRYQVHWVTLASQPLQQLAAVFVDPETSSVERADQLHQAERLLQEGAPGLVRLIQSRLTGASDSLTQLPTVPGTCRFVLVLDQFEQLLALGPEGQGVIDILTGALRLAGDWFTVVAGLRSDALPLVQGDRVLSMYVDEARVTLAAPTEKELRQAIARPAERVDCALEPSLIQALLLDVTGSPAPFPLVQGMMAELWQQAPTTETERLTLEHYLALGGVRGLVQRWATAMWEALEESQQALMQHVLLALVHVGEETEVARRRVLKPELLGQAFEERAVEDMLARLAAHYLVVTDRIQDSGGMAQTTVDLVHGALIHPWEPMQQWLATHRDRLLRQRRLERLAQDWLRRGQPIRAEYLLAGTRLREAEAFLAEYPMSLSGLAMQYVTLSQTESRRTHTEFRMLQMMVPCVLLAAIAVTVAQYRVTAHSQVEKEQHLRLANSRQTAAIAQNILDTSSGDPAAALLISRAAAEQGGRTREIEDSLRSALQRLRQQKVLWKHSTAIAQVAFTPQRDRLLTVDEANNLKLWDIDTQELAAAWDWSSDQAPSIQQMALGSGGDQVAFAVKNEADLRLWQVSHQRMLRMKGLRTAATAIALDPQGRWLAAVGDHQMAVWRLDDRPAAEVGTPVMVVRHAKPLHSLTFSPDGRQLLMAGKTSAAQLWRLPIAPKGKITSPQLLNHGAPLTQATMSTDGRAIATVSEDGTIKLWDSQTARLLRRLPLGAERPPEDLNYRLKLSADATQIALWDDRGGLWLWKVTDFEPVRLGEVAEAQEALQGLRQVEFSGGGQLLVSVVPESKHQSEAVQVWETQTGKAIAHLPREDGAILGASFTEDGSSLVTARQTGTIARWQLHLGGELPSLRMASGPIRWVMPLEPRPAAPSDFDQELTTASAPATFGAAMWSTSPLALALTSEAKASRVMPLLSLLSRFSRSSPKTLAALQDSQRIAQAYRQNASTERSSAVMTVSESGELQVWNVLTGESVGPSVSLLADNLEGRPPALLTGVAYSPTTRHLAIASAEGAIALRILQPDGTLSSPQPLPVDLEIDPAADAPSVILRSLAFSADGAHLLAIGDDLTVRVWDLATGTLRHLLRGHQATIAMARFSQDGQRIVTASWDRTAQIWDVASGEGLQVLSHSDAVSGAAFSPDGQFVVTSSWDGMARVMHGKTGQVQVLLPGDGQPLLDVEYSPTGQSIVTASTDGSAGLWDAKTGLQQAKLRPQRSGTATLPMQQAQFTPDGRWLMSLSEDGQVYNWAATWSALLKLARDRSDRQLTPEECLRYLQVSPEVCSSLPDSSGLPTPSVLISAGGPHFL